MTKVVAIIQARLGSKRLPGKMMLSLHGYPIIDWVLHRVKRARRLDQIVLAIPDGSRDDPLAAAGEAAGVNVFRGSEDDVLGRFCAAAQQFEADLIVRICADNPLIDPVEIDNLVDHFKSIEVDYAYNNVPRQNKYPDGLGAEIISAQLLQRLGELAILKAHREHCFSYIWDNTDDFEISTFDPPRSVLHKPNLKLDVDTLDDYLRLSALEINIDIDAPSLLEAF